MDKISSPPNPYGVRTSAIDDELQKRQAAASQEMMRKMYAYELESKKHQRQAWLAEQKARYAEERAQMVLEAEAERKRIWGEDLLEIMAETDRLVQKYLTGTEA